MINTIVFVRFTVWGKFEIYVSRGRPWTILGGFWSPLGNFFSFLMVLGEVGILIEF